MSTQRFYVPEDDAVVITKRTEERAIPEACARHLVEEATGGDC